MPSPNPCHLLQFEPSDDINRRGRVSSFCGIVGCAKPNTFPAALAFIAEYLSGDKPEHGPSTPRQPRGTREQKPSSAVASVHGKARASTAAASMLVSRGPRAIFKFAVRDARCLPRVRLR
ncbi:hypothetical protein E5D57_010748 [Metarhizium anisopliae]|nr:hypothetical protein E5D57_010748 [Metarhizium anisopliae]